MKFHWGECLEEEHLKEKNNAQKDIMALLNKIRSLNQEFTTLSQEKTKIELQNATLLKQNEEILKNHTFLEERLFAQQEKIKHLEEVISDYSKASLLEKAPAYVEIVPLKEVEYEQKSRRSKK